MTDLLADYTEYSSDTRAASVYRTWKRQNPGEARQWETFDTELKAGNRPAPPTLKTSYGQSLVGAGVIYLHATETPAQPTPPGPVPEQYGQLGLYQLAGGNVATANPSILLLLSVLPCTLIAVALFTYVPARAAARRSVAAALRSE